MRDHSYRFTYIIIQRNKGPPLKNKTIHYFYINNKDSKSTDSVNKQQWGFFLSGISSNIWCANYKACRVFSSHTLKGEWSSQKSQIQWLQTYPKSSASTSDSATCICSCSCLHALGKLFLTKPVPTPRKISLQRTKGLCSAKTAQFGSWKETQMNVWIWKEVNP